MALEPFDLGLLGGDDVLGELLHLPVLGVAQSHLRHVYGALVVGDHRVDEALVGVLAVLRQHPGGHAPGPVIHAPHALHAFFAPGLALGFALGFLRFVFAAVIHTLHAALGCGATPARGQR